jgi:soluble lytic murein transglycosylase-like protein
MSKRILVSGRILATLLGLSALAVPAWAPMMADEASRVEAVQWADAQQIASEYRIRLRQDSLRLTDSLAFQIVQAADRHAVPLHIAFRLIWAESRFKVDAKGTVGDAGLAQVLPTTARRVCNIRTVRKLYDPATNLDCGFKYFSSLLRRYDNLEWFALVAYNRGPRIADSLKAQGRGYPERILALE